MTRVKASNVPASDFNSIQVNDSDFVAAPAEGTSVSSGEVEEIARSEVSEDGQLASYSTVQLGGETDPMQLSSEGKMFIDLRDTNDNPVDDRTEIRFIARPKNGDSRTDLTGWYPLRDLNRDDPRQRVPLDYVTDMAGRPQLVGRGRILAMEIRNGGTSVTISLSNSTIQLPAEAGY